MIDGLNNLICYLVYIRIMCSRANVLLLHVIEPTVVGLAPAKTDQNQKKVKRGERKIEKVSRRSLEKGRVAEGMSQSTCRSMMCLSVFMLHH